ncbi:MAG: DUF58 domain-containing protein [Bacteroidaceae bacterium]|nr:DUF58 domain-containing protein [Bacteroidaceae bacterium]
MFLTRRFFLLLGISIIVVACGALHTGIFIAGCVMTVAVFAAAAVERQRLYAKVRGVEAERIVADRLSNGDDNEVEVKLRSSYPFMVDAEVIDEMPVIFQVRDFSRRLRLAPGDSASISYVLRPKERGSYGFGRIRVFATTAWGLVQRRFTLAESKEVKVYPSYLQLNKYELTTLRTNTETGNKRIRRIGNATEFAQIKDYVPDDDYRKINWKASARRHQLMVNVYEDERAQHVYNVIDTGRVMQQTFQGMTLLDHAINASLVLSHIALRKDDNVGLATFNNKPGAFLASARRQTQMTNILETLYNIHTEFQESDFAALSTHILKFIRKRSLIILYTNFFSINALRRQLPYLRQISKHHRLLIVFFEDNEQNDYIKSAPESVEEYFRHVVAEKNAMERRSIITLLQQNGILALLTEPQHLTVDVLNKYIDIKMRNMI